MNGRATFQARHDCQRQKSDLVLTSAVLQGQRGLRRWGSNKFSGRNTEKSIFKDKIFVLYITYFLRIDYVHSK